MSDLTRADIEALRAKADGATPMWMGTTTVSREELGGHYGQIKDLCDLALRLLDANAAAIAFLHDLAKRGQG